MKKRSKEVNQMSDLIDKVLFQELAACDPGSIVGRTGAAYDSVTGQYKVEVWGNMYGVDPANCRVEAMDQEMLLPLEYIHLFILHYLMKARNIPLADEWVSEKDIPGGSAFFRGPHTLPAHKIAQVFGDDINGFSNICTKAGGRAIPMADAAFAFDIAPKIPVAVLFWPGDEDFGAEAKLLFDRTISFHLPLDIIFALAVIVCRRLG